MADFERVLRRSLSGVAAQSVEARDRLYAEAFSAVERQLRSLSPAPSEAMIQRQLQKLKDAVIVVEADFGNDVEKPLAVRTDNTSRATRANRNVYAFVSNFVPADLATDFLLNLEEMRPRWATQHGEKAANGMVRWECFSFVLLYQLGRMCSLSSLLRRLIS